MTFQNFLTHTEAETEFAVVTRADITLFIKWQDGFIVRCFTKSTELLHAVDRSNQQRSHVYVLKPDGDEAISKTPIFYPSYDKCTPAIISSTDRFHKCQCTFVHLVFWPNLA